MNVHSAPPKDTRSALLAAALTLFAERGFHGTAVPDIARGAGVASGTVYRHFASKDELVNHLYRSCKTALIDRLLAGIRPSDAPRIQFRCLWTALAEHAQDAPFSFDFLELHHHASYLDAESRALELRSLLRLIDVLRSAHERGMPQPLAVETTLALVWGAFVGLVKASRLGYLTLDAATVTAAEEACWNAITA